jgi:hypothetical protein
MLWSLRRIRWVVTYIVVVTVACLPPLFDGKFAFVYLSAVTVPWNGLLIAAMDALAPSIRERWYIPATVGALAISAVLNCVALYAMGRKADQEALQRGQHRQ